MQQTETYKLNLIEPSDPFLPDGLNANTQLVEDVLNAMDTRVQVLEGRHFVAGTYVGGVGRTHIKLPFTPQAVMIADRSGTGPNFCVAVSGGDGFAYNGLVLEEDGFSVGGEAINMPYSYPFFAFG